MYAFQSVINGARHEALKAKDKIGTAWNCLDRTLDGIINYPIDKIDPDWFTDAKRELIFLTAALSNFSYYIKQIKTSLHTLSQEGPR